MLTETVTPYMLFSVVRCASWNDESSDCDSQRHYSVTPNKSFYTWLCLQLGSQDEQNFMHAPHCLVQHSLKRLFSWTLWMKKLSSMELQKRFLKWNTLIAQLSWREQAAAHNFGSFARPFWWRRQFRTRAPITLRWSHLSSYFSDRPRQQHRFSCSKNDCCDPNATIVPAKFSRCFHINRSRHFTRPM